MKRLSLLLLSIAATATAFAAAGDAKVVAGIQFRWCPPGKFVMGSPPSEPERRPGEDQVEVTLTRGFWMAKFETTQGDWKRIMGKLPGPLTDELPEGDDYPVGNVNFAEAEAYCRKLTEVARASREIPATAEFRLPTEAQWEYACRAGTTTATAFGDKLSSRQANFKGAPYNGAERGPSLGRAAKVGSYPPNAWGLHDMHGNTFEWCRDWYHAKYPGGIDPDLHDALPSAALNRTGDASRSRRGGCWADEGWPCRSAFRLRFEPGRRYDHIGFRVLLIDLAQKENAMRDIEFASIGGHKLALDLHLPTKQKGPLIVFVHGGAWRSGSKNEMPLGALVDAGFPVASVDYRLSTAAKFPAQVHDIKAAIRFLRAEQNRLGIDARKIVIAGSSAGGHLAALVGVTNGDEELKGNVGAHLKESSAVQGIVSFYGGANLTTILAQSTPHGLSVRVPALELLLGGKPEERKELARLASPVFHVDANDPPVLLFHGDQDAQMPINQAHELMGAYEKAGIGARAWLKVLYGAGHGGKVFYDAAQMAAAKEFLKKISK